jgi:hypothetical protein
MTIIGFALIVLILALISLGFNYIPGINPSFKKIVFVMCIVVAILVALYALGFDSLDVRIPRIFGAK